jgi:predicted O-methyltransferase YrrM
VLRALAGGSGLPDDQLRTAVVGYHASFLRNAETLADCGFAVSYFAGRADDIYHASRPLSELNPAEFDCVLVADESSEEEFCKELAAKGAKPIRIMQIVKAHVSVLKSLSYRGVVSCLNPYKQAVITAVVAISDPDGIIIECGVYMGGTTIQMALLQRLLGIKRLIFALDTYQGMPEPTEADYGGGFIYTAGMFSDTRRNLVQSYYQKAGVAEDIQIVPGLCQTTLPTIIRQNPNVAFAFLDTDQYAGTKGGLDTIGPILKKGAAIVIDDTTVRGVNVAIKEALERDPGLARSPVLMNFDLVMRR